MATMLSLSHLLPLLLLQLSFSFFISSAYDLPDKYFLNCGSETDTQYGSQRLFVGDAKDGLQSVINPGKSKVVKNDTVPKSIHEIYHTARVYNKPTWYVFGSSNPNGTYVVRLHFFLVSTQILSQARFNVSASSGFRLLSNFSLQNSDFKTDPVVKEFAFEVEEGPFGIQFSPLESSDLAFVNAIEVFLAPEKFKPEYAYRLSPELEINRNRSFQYAMTSEAFQAVYRVSMGGSLVTPDMDRLGRTWLPDDKFLVLPLPAQNVYTKYQVKPTWSMAAPSSVYGNSRALDMNAISGSKITWSFKVKKKSKYFLRLHFCDIILQGQEFRFNYFVGVNETWLDSKEELPRFPVRRFADPFWFEFAVFTDSSGYFNFGIAHNKGAPFSKAFLNGAEIMELIEKSLVGPADLRLKEEKQNQKMIIVGVCVGVAVIVDLIICLAMFYFIRRGKSKKHRPFPVPQTDPSEKFTSIANLAPNLNLELKIPFAQLAAATNNFDDKKIIGIGGFGKVYLGTIGDRVVAVKRSQLGHAQGIKEFQTEVIILSQIRYGYLVSFYGYCDENQEMILVYEYMEGGTLREYLYGSKTKDRIPLSWKQRLEICINAAKGLDYLHTGATVGVIIHRDIKTTNILLDKDSNAKVADFGISKTGVSEASELDTTIRGTYGYLDPEYFETGQLTEKSDIYSFGVVLFEVLAARAPIEKSVPSEETNLADWALLCKSKGEIERMIDPFLVGTIEANSLRKFVETAEKCMDEVGKNRPSMHEVVYDLELAFQFQFTPLGGRKGYEGRTTIVNAPWDIDSGILDRIPSRGLDDSVMVLDEGSTIVNARELVVEFKIDCAR